MLRATRLEILDELDIEFIPAPSPSPMMAFINHLAVGAELESDTRYVCYAYEYDIHEPDHLIFAVTVDGVEQEYLVPLTHQWDWSGCTATYAGSTLSLCSIKRVTTHPASFNEDGAIYAPYLSMDNKVPAAVRTELLKLAQKQMKRPSPYKLNYVA